jgi:N-sulfoglucosamine sulfohydrolase
MKKFPLLILLLHFLLSLNAQQTKPLNNQPYNIVLFIADDLGVNDIGPYGNKIVRTPNLNAFSKEALLFTRAFASSPTCTPSRSSIYTGLMPIRHGAHGNHGGVTARTQSLVQYLQPMGYRVAIAGKLHVGPEDVFSFERISKSNVIEPGHEKQPGLNYDLNLAPVDKWLSQQQPNKPFMLIVADHSPHVVWPEKATYDPNDVDIPAKHIDTKETRMSRARYYTDVTKMDNNVGKLLSSLEKNGLSKNTIL